MGEAVSGTHRAIRRAWTISLCLVAVIAIGAAAWLVWVRPALMLERIEPGTTSWWQAPAAAATVVTQAQAQPGQCLSIESLLLFDDVDDNLAGAAVDCGAPTSLVRVVAVSPDEDLSEACPESCLDYVDNHGWHYAVNTIPHPGLCMWGYGHDAADDRLRLRAYTSQLGDCRRPFPEWLSADEAAQAFSEDESRPVEAAELTAYRYTILSVLAPEQDCDELDGPYQITWTTYFQEDAPTKLCTTYVPTD
jgi:hypothetical protein